MSISILMFYLLHTAYVKSFYLSKKRVILEILALRKHRFLNKTFCILTLLCFYTTNYIPESILVVILCIYNVITTQISVKHTIWN